MLLELFAGMLTEHFDFIHSSQVDLSLQGVGVGVGGDDMIGWCTWLQCSQVHKTDQGSKALVKFTWDKNESWKTFTMI